jgi:hypothetical protein
MEQENAEILDGPRLVKGKLVRRNASVPLNAV